MNNPAIEYLDLVGRPWAEMNCGEVVVEVLTRLGRAPGPLDVPLTREALGAVLLASGGRPTPDPWEPVVGPLRPGDVVVSAPSPETGAHASTVIDKAGRFALTSEKVGGVFVTPVSRIKGRESAWRFVR